MIYEFSFDNYRSYKDENTMSFIAKSINEFEDSLIDGMDEKLVPISAIYGPNGGGKSSVLMAFRFFTSLIVSPLINLQNIKGDVTDNDIKTVTSKWHRRLSREFFRWDEECADKPSNFSILFQRKDTKYRYELSVLDSIIVSEALYIQRNDNELKTIFEREKDDIELAESIIENFSSTEININENLPFIVYVGMLMDIEEIDEVLRFFFSVEYINFDNVRRDYFIPMKKIVDNKDEILRVTQSMGIPICDLRVEYDEDGAIKEVYSKHCIDGIASTTEMKFGAESSGTRKIFSFIFGLLKSIESGQFVLIDELDAKLHPLLLKSIIELFTNPNINKNGAQLLFTSHDMVTMSKDIFRRDEIWFAALNNRDESYLYSLVDFKKENGKKPRNDETYGKQYIEGRYGADPYIKRIIEWENLK